MSISALTQELIEPYINRKREGRIDFVVNLETDEYNIVPKDMEHKDYMPMLDRKDDSSLVPFWFKLERENSKYIVREIILGASSFEATTGVKHTPAQLFRARELAYMLAINNDLLIELDRERILKTFCDFTKD